MFWRLQFVIIITVFVCGPSLARASQRLDPIDRSTQAMGLSRNCDAPPERVQLSGSPSMLSVDFVDMVDGDGAIVNPERVPFHRVTGHEPVPLFPLSSPPDSLRAPPVPRS